jgi:hypothetical protein
MQVTLMRTFSYLELCTTSAQKLDKGNIYDNLGFSKEMQLIQFLIDSDMQ